VLVSGMRLWKICGGLKLKLSRKSIKLLSVYSRKSNIGVVWSMPVRYEVICTNSYLVSLVVHNKF